MPINNKSRNYIIEEDLERIVNSSLPWNEFQNKTVLVTGANGFLPAYMVETLLYLNERSQGQNTKVIGLVRNREKALKRFHFYDNRKDFQFIVQDVCAPLSINEKVDFIVHAASQASPKYFSKDPVGTISANILGTYNLLTLAMQQKVKGFLFFSSGEVYGQIEESKNSTKEDDYGYVNPMDVRSCYAESKRMAENMCVCWFSQYGVPVKVVRPYHNYGPGMDLEDGRVFADFVSDIVNNRNIEMKSDGSEIRAFCYLADATIGYFTVLLRGESGQAYNIGNDNAKISILEFAKTLIALFPEKNLSLVINDRIKKENGYLKSKISYRHCPNIIKANKIGWQPTTSIKEGFLRAVKSYT